MKKFLTAIVELWKETFGKKEPKPWPKIGDVKIRLLKSRLFHRRNGDLILLSAGEYLVKEIPESTGADGRLYYYYVESKDAGAPLGYWIGLREVGVLEVL